MADSLPGRPYIVRYLEDENEVADVVGNVARGHSDAFVTKRESLLFRRCLQLTATAIYFEKFRDYCTWEPDPTGRATRVLGFSWDHFERDVAGAAKKLVGMGHPDILKPEVT